MGDQGLLYPLSHLFLQKLWGVKKSRIIVPHLTDEQAESL